MTSGETVTILQAGGVLCLLNSSGSGNCARLCEGGVAFRPADFGLVHVSQEHATDPLNASRYCACLAGPHLFHFAVSSSKMVIAGSKMVLPEALYCPLSFQVKLLCPCEQLGS